MFSVPEKFRLLTGSLGSSSDDGNNGAFIVKLKHSQTVFCIASDGMGWEHVSASRQDRCPTWDEMCQIKNLFWGEDVACLQFHPKKQDYVNMHKYCLHIWRPVDGIFPMPDSLMVGYPCDKAAI